MDIRYQRIGAGYAGQRSEDPVVYARILAALGGTQSVVNVGAGAGSYEPRDRRVLAIEPSRVMVGQRGPGRAPAVLASADALPLADHSFDAALSVLSLHHWDDGRERGVRELRRVARGPVVIASIDAAVSGGMWLMAEYLPEVAALDHRIFPPLDVIANWLGGRSEVHVIEIERDTPDHTLMSFWAHPERVLDAAARNATSGFARMDEAVTTRVVNAVRADLESGAWDRRHAELRTRSSFDAGLRLLVNTPE